MDQRDLFLSHSSGDAGAARELRAELEAAGYSCWMAPDDVDGTDPWAEQILAAIEACSAMLVLISTHANRSPHVSREVNLALGRRRPVLPIRIEEVAPEASLEYLLSLVQRIDAFPPPIANHAPRIVRRLDSVLRRAGKPISEPVVVPLPPADPPAGVPDTELAASRPASETPPAEAELPTEPVPTASHAGPVALGPGVRVGAFEIESILGEGGMATIYRARQTEPRRAVALKVIRADHAADPVYRTRFLGEKDTLAALEHPSIVPIYAAGEADGVLYIAMRLVDGPDLAGRIESKGRLSVEETIATLRPIADAVDYAHEQGVVHRDLKPSNIILDSKGRPYLTDFGLGKHFDKSQGLSSPGIALGTLAYMAPEQFSGLTEPALAGRIDVYALACVAWTCLTGTPPFDGATPERMMFAHLHESLPSRADIPDSIEAVIRRALAKAPGDRYPTAAEFIQALSAAASTTVLPTAAIPVRRPSGGAIVAGWFARTGSVGVAAVILTLLIAISGGIVLIDPAGWFGGVAAITDGPSTSATASPTDPATDTPGPTPTPDPGDTVPPTEPPPTPTDVPPTPTHDPGPTPDNKGPTGTGLSISAKVEGDGVVTAKSVTLNVTASGATQMLLGRASSKTGPCTWDGSWIPLQSRVTGFPLQGGGNDGRRWVCLKTRDAAENESGVERDSVFFDNAPLAEQGGLFEEPASFFNTYDTWNWIFFPTGAGSFPIATDADGLGTLRVTKLWQIKTDGSTINFSSALIEGGTKAHFDPPATYCDGGEFSYKMGFTVKDSHDVARNGWFTVHVCY